MHVSWYHTWYLQAIVDLLVVNALVRVKMVSHPRVMILRVRILMLSQCLLIQQTHHRGRKYKSFRKCLGPFLDRTFDVDLFCRLIKKF